MIFMFCVLIGVVYSIMRFVFGISKKITNIVTVVCIVGLGIVLDFVNETNIEFTSMAVILSACIILVCSDGERIVSDKDAMRKAIDEQERQEKYDNEWGYIHTTKK